MPTIRLAAIIVGFRRGTVQADNVRHVDRHQAAVGHLQIDDRAARRIATGGRRLGHDHAGRLIAGDETDVAAGEAVSRDRAFGGRLLQTDVIADRQAN